MNYSYLAYTASRQLVKGRINAPDERTATELLGRAGYQIVTLKPVTPFMPDLSRFLRAPANRSEMILFSRQLALLLEAGVGIIQALELLYAQTGDRSLKAALRDVIADIRSGKPLSSSMSKHPHVFPPLYARMVRVGEQTGAIEQVLRNLADHMEREAQAIARLKQALTYPTVVLALGVIVAIILVTVLLPPLMQMFTRFGAQLPLPTRMLIALMAFIKGYGLYLLLGLLGAVIVLYLFFRTRTGRYYRDLLLLKIPVLGKLIHVTELARICRNFSLLFRAGLPLPEAMRLIAQTTNNRVIAAAVQQVHEEMLRGKGLSRPMRQQRVFLPLMVEMTRVGEETGNLDETLMIVAQNYEIEADRRTQTILGLVEPVMTIAIGGFVGFLALSVFMPIYSALKLVG